ncbi:MAG: gliding motility-associated ABC transporter substrate-binding protein GldG [Chitinophagaceae bacterium]
MKLSQKSLSIRFVILSAILVLLNLIAQKVNFRLDVTKEKRFSLSQPTKKLLKNVKEPIIVEIYLQGKFPAGFQKLAETTKDVLNEFKAISNNQLRFKFINPLEGKSDEEKKQMIQKLYDQGIAPVNLQVQQDEDEGYSQKIIFPAAKVSYLHKDIAVNLLESHISMSPAEKLNYAENMVEYKFANAIKQLMQPDKRKIAYAVGNGELLGDNTYDMLTTLGNIYDVDTIDLNKNIEISPVYKALMIAKPSIEIDEKVKFKIDQYVMQGGNVLWCIDPMHFAMDSLIQRDASMAMPIHLNLDDMLFNFGVRINSDLIEDYLHANPIPVTVGYVGNNPDIRLLPWLYNTFSIATSKHPIVNNLDAVMFVMSSSIDTIKNNAIKKTVLLHTSNRARTLPAPVRISMSNLRFKPDAVLYKQKDIPQAVLLEGKFSSIYANRLDPVFIKIYEDSLKKKYLPTAQKASKQIVISDGDVVMNDFIKSRGPLECGYYKYTEQLFANKTFLLNCLEYLTDDFNILEARNKNLTLRLLDTERIKNEKIKWQLFNILSPLVLLIIFASAYFFFRKKKYEGKV